MRLCLPDRLPNEAPEGFVDRTVESAMRVAALENTRRIIDRTNAGEEWPKTYICKFIEAGLVHYADIGTVLVQKAALDRMARSFVGKPVVNVVHKEVAPNVYARGEADGIVTRVWFEPADGWYWCEYIVWDRATQHNCESDAYSVSCAYRITAVGEGGAHNNVPYEQEILDGEYTHLAIVANPRYEGARIFVNSKGGSDMWKFLRFGQGKKEPLQLENAAEAVVEIDGKKVPVKELVELHNAQEQARAAAAGATVSNALNEDDIVEIDGKEVSVKNLVGMYREKRNADEEAEKKAKEDEDRKNAEEDERKRKEEEERKNAEEADRKKKEEEEEERKNTKHFQDLKNAAERRGDPQKPQIVTAADRAKIGAERYGSVKK